MAIVNTSTYSTPTAPPATPTQGVEISADIILQVLDILEEILTHTHTHLDT